MDHQHQHHHQILVDEATVGQSQQQYDGAGYGIASADMIPYNGSFDDYGHEAATSYGTFEDYIPSEPAHHDEQHNDNGHDMDAPTDGAPSVPVDTEPPDLDFETMRATAMATRSIGDDTHATSISDDDSDDDGVQEFLVRPVRTNALAYRIDPLPQPYRMIDEIVQRLVRRAADLGASCAAAHPGKRAMDVLRGRPPLDLTSAPLPPPPAAGTPTAYPQSVVEWRQFGRITAAAATPSSSNSGNGGGNSDSHGWIIGNDQGYVFFIDLQRTLTVTAQIRLPLPGANNDASLMGAPLADDYNAITSIQCGIVNPVEDVEVVNTEFRVLITVGAREIYAFGLDTMTPHFIEGCIIRPPLPTFNLNGAAASSAASAAATTTSGSEKTPRTRGTAAAAKGDAKKSGAINASAAGTAPKRSSKSTTNKGDSSARSVGTTASVTDISPSSSSLLPTNMINSIISVTLSQDTFYMSVSLADGTLLVYDIREARRREEFRATTPPDHDPETERSSPTNDGNDAHDGHGPNSTAFGRGGRGPGIVAREMILECRLILRVPLASSLAALWIKQRLAIIGATATTNTTVTAPSPTPPLLSRAPSSASSTAGGSSSSSSSLPVPHVHFIRVMCERKISAPTVYATRGLIVWWSGDASFHRYHLPHAATRSPQWLIDILPISLPLPSSSSSSLRSNLPTTLPTISSSKSTKASSTRAAAAAATTAAPVAVAEPGLLLSTTPAQSWSLGSPISVTTMDDTSTLLAVGTESGAVLVYDNNLGCDKYILSPHRLRVTSLSFCGHHFLVSGGEDGIVQMYDLLPSSNDKSDTQPRMMRGESMPGGIRFVLALQQLPLALCAVNGSPLLLVYDLESGVVIARLEARNPQTTHTRANFVLSVDIMDAQSGMLLATAEKEAVSSSIIGGSTGAKEPVSTSVVVFPMIHLLTSIYPSIARAIKNNPHMQHHGIAMFLSTSHVNRLRMDAFDAFQPPANDPLSFSIVQSFSHDVHSFRGGRSFGRNMGMGMGMASMFGRGRGANGAPPGSSAGIIGGHTRGPSLTGGIGGGSHQRNASRISNHGGGGGHHRTPSELKRQGSSLHGRRSSLSNALHPHAAVPSSSNVTHHGRVGSVALAAGLNGSGASSSGPSHSFTKVFGAPLQLPPHVPDNDRPITISLSGNNGGTRSLKATNDEKDSKDHHGNDDDHDDHDDEVFNDLSKHVFNQLKRRENGRSERVTRITRRTKEIMEQLGGGIPGVVTMSQADDARRLGQTNSNDVASGVGSAPNSTRLTVVLTQTTARGGDGQRTMLVAPRSPNPSSSNHHTPVPSSRAANATNNTTSSGMTRNGSGSSMFPAIRASSSSTNVIATASTSGTRNARQ